MSTWLTIEDAVVAALGQIEIAGQPALAMVRGETCRDRKMLAAQIGRERLPAAYVVITGRDAGEKLYRRAGDVLLTVLYASRSERSDHEARRGGTGVLGAFAIAQAAATALQDLDLGEQRRLVLVDEHPVGGDEGTVLWEQRYETRVRSGEYAATFAGQRLIGDLSEVQVEVGSLCRASSTFAFPGVDGVFERSAGTRERPIVWRGQLRAGSDEALNEIEADIEDFIREGVVDVLVDPWGRRFEHCVVKRLGRKGTRRRDGLTGQAVQDFELEFSQLAG